MTLILYTISQDRILLLGFETRFSFELILCNQLLVSKVIFTLLQAWTCRQETSFFREPQKFLIYWGTMEKKYKAKSFL